MQRAANDTPAANPLKRPSPTLELVGASAPALRARTLFHEAREAAMDHVRLLQQAIAQVRDLSDAVLEGGDVYDPGVREFARQLSETMLWKGRSLEVLAARQTGVATVRRN